ncbi:MAG: hypothetical protein NC206_04560 [Bacteroides sp.]|nr:hypothetical protein [Roseburia sp.]MCM1346336.1 hypothetical protein [Bacteroides sp.]MCM1420925.1 hypothetical protein [Bacteroides sp.]
MKKFFMPTGNLLAASFTALLAASCESELSREHIIGRWELVSIESEINGVPDPTGDIAHFDNFVCYEFKSDSTYILNEGGNIETGTWTLRDSIIGTLLDGLEDDSTNYLWYHITEIDDSMMISSSITESPYGKLTDIFRYKKIAK